METSLEKAPLILGIESSGKWGGIALFQEVLLYEINFYIRQSYSQSLFQALPFFLEKAQVNLRDIDYIAVDVGPGSFTGLRIGISAVKAFSLVYSFPLIPLSSLEILAYNYSEVDLPILSLVDAYTQEIFLAQYRFKNQEIQTLITPRLSKVREIKEIVQEPTLFVSETLEKWEDFLKRELSAYFIKPPLKPRLRASLLCEIAWLKLKKGEAEVISGKELLPFYLKPSEAERKKCFSSF